MKIVIIDDSYTFREGLRFFLENQLHHEVIGEASNGKEFLELEAVPSSDIVLIDIEMPELNGIEAIQKYLSNYPFLRAIAITMYTDQVYLKQLIEVGFKGCVFKKSLFEHLEEAIELVSHGKFYFPEDIAI